MTQPVLSVTGLTKAFPIGKGRAVRAVNGVDLDIRPGEVMGMVGESGSGKSTFGRAVLRLTDPTEGRIYFRGKDITRLPLREIRPMRRDMTMVFQDPWSALNPRMSVKSLIAEPLKLHMSLSRSERDDRVEALARRVHLNPAALTRTPAGLSGGQLQRVCIARAIATNPALIVLDEPTSSLDLSVRAGILELLEQIRAETQAAMLFISHDLGTVRLISQRVAVLYLGQVVEEGPAETLFEAPEHPYTQALLSAHMPADPDHVVHRHVLEGEVPSPIDLPPGCPFQTRCPLVLPACRAGTIVPDRLADDHRVRCVRVATGDNKLPVKEPA
ncbi:ABC transporter ATP-binding protein [Salipiger sp.]|uniref:ABC transporter ATP-binding protein n=1 Tax=Salipiger sp. TaxID=2078585 RepID=UPI003A97B175